MQPLIKGVRAHILHRTRRITPRSNPAHRLTSLGLQLRHILQQMLVAGGRQDDVIVGADNRVKAISKGTIHDVVVVITEIAWLAKDFQVSVKAANNGLGSAQIDRHFGTVLGNACEHHPQTFAVYC